MSIEQFCMLQEERIEKQEEIIRRLLLELMQFRALNDEELRFLENESRSERKNEKQGKERAYKTVIPFQR